MDGWMDGWMDINEISTNCPHKDLDLFSFQFGIDWILHKSPSFFVLVRREETRLSGPLVDALGVAIPMVAMDTKFVARLQGDLLFTLGLVSDGCHVDASGLTAVKKDVI